jgi:hypothetical protein
MLRRGPHEVTNRAVGDSQPRRNSERALFMAKTLPGDSLRKRFLFGSSSPERTPRRTNGGRPVALSGPAR